MSVITDTQMAAGVPQAPDTSVRAYYNSQGKSGTFLRNLGGGLGLDAGYNQWKQQLLNNYNKQVADYKETYESANYQKKLLEEAGYNPNYINSSGGGSSAASPFNYQETQPDLQGAKTLFDIGMSFVDPSQLINVGRDMLGLVKDKKENESIDLSNQLMAEKVESQKTQNLWLNTILGNKAYQGDENLKGSFLKNTQKVFDLYGHGLEDNRGETFGYQTRGIQESASEYERKILQYTLNYQKAKAFTQQLTNSQMAYYNKHILPLEMKKLQLQALGYGYTNEAQSIQNELNKKYGKWHHISGISKTFTGSVSDLITGGSAVAKCVQAFKSLDKVTPMKRVEYMDYHNGGWTKQYEYE